MLKPTSQEQSALGLVIIGAGGLAREAVDVATACGLNVLACVDSTLTSHEAATRDVLGVPVVHSLSHLDERKNICFFVAIGHNYVRQRVAVELKDRVKVGQLVSLIHPAASVSRFASVGRLTLILPGCVVLGSANVGEGCYLSANTVVRHDVVLGRFASLAAGAKSGGGSRIGERVAMGLNSSCRERTTIGNDSIVGANSFVKEHLPPHVVAGGVPAHVLHTRLTEDPYLRLGRTDTFVSGGLAGPTDPGRRAATEQPMRE